MSFKLPKTTVFIDADIETLRAEGGRTFKPDAAASLVKQYDEKGTLSDKQWAFVASLVKGLQPKPAPVARPAQAAATVSTTIVSLFDKAAAAGLQVPHISARHFYAYRATERSKNPGSVTILASRGGTYYGSIMRDGALRLGRDCPPVAALQIKAFAADPISSSMVEGRSVGKCVFCNLTLRKDESQTVGYGPDCAANYGLPWGETVKKHNVAVSAEELMS